jgi:lipoprotein-releasing system ATP-binding protein
LMIDTAKKQGTAFVVVTHDPHLASRCSRVLRLDRGVLQT